MVNKLTIACTYMNMLILFALLSNNFNIVIQTKCLPCTLLQHISIEDFFSYAINMMLFSQPIGNNGNLILINWISYLSSWSPPPFFLQTWNYLPLVTHIRTNRQTYTYTYQNIFLPFFIHLCYEAIITSHLCMIPQDLYTSGVPLYLLLCNNSQENFFSNSFMYFIDWV